MWSSSTAPCSRAGKWRAKPVRRAAARSLAQSRRFENWSRGIASSLSPTKSRTIADSADAEGARGDLAPAQPVALELRRPCPRGASSPSKKTKISVGRNCRGLIVRASCRTTAVPEARRSRRRSRADPSCRSGRRATTFRRGFRPGIVPTTFRSPPGTAWKRPRGIERRSISASSRDSGEPAGRGPSATWRFRNAQAERSSNRSGPAVPCGAVSRRRLPREPRARQLRGGRGARARAWCLRRAPRACARRAGRSRPARRRSTSFISTASQCGQRRTCPARGRRRRRRRPPRPRRSRRRCRSPPSSRPRRPGAGSRPRRFRPALIHLILPSVRSARCGCGRVVAELDERARDRLDERRRAADVDVRALRWRRPDLGEHLARRRAARSRSSPSGCARVSVWTTRGPRRPSCSSSSR